jgi:hypothetical protein
VSIRIDSDSEEFDLSEENEGGNVYVELTGEFDSTFIECNFKLITNLKQIIEETE